MNLGLSIAVYLICWWTVLFAILPIRIKTQGESGEVVRGTPESAPVLPHLMWKALLTTIVSAIVFAIIYCVITYQWIRLDDIPFFPRFEKTI